MNRFIGLFLLFLAIPCMLTACGSKSNTATDEVYVDPYQEVADAFAQREYKLASDLATQIIDNYGETVEALTYRGVAQAKLNLPYLAFADLLRAISIDYNVNTLMNLGVALRMFGYCARATDAFEQALALDPSNQKILMNLTSSYMCIGEYEQANDYFAQATQNFEKNAISYTNAATLKWLEEDAEQARMAAEKAIQLDALYRPAYKTLSSACKALGDRQCAKDADQQYNNLTGFYFKQRKNQRIRIQR